MPDAVLANPLNESYLGGLVQSWEIVKSRALQVLSRSAQTTSSGSNYLVLVGESRKTGSILIRNTSSTDSETTATLDQKTLPSTRALVLIVKSRFGLNTTELARVLRVGRPTVYSWLNDEVELHSSNSRRLRALARLAEAVDGPPTLDAITAGGSSLLDHLSATELNLELLRSSLASATQRTAVKSSRLDAALHGYQSPEGARHQLDLFTGRPLIDDE